MVKEVEKNLLADALIEFDRLQFEALNEGNLQKRNTGYISLYHKGYRAAMLDVLDYMWDVLLKAKLDSDVATRIRRKRNRAK